MNGVYLKYKVGKKFAEDPDTLKQGKTPLTQVFPGKMFERLLELRQRLEPKTPGQFAEYIFELLSKQDTASNTSMHTTWQKTLLMGPPSGSGCVSDSLGPLIAGFDRLLSETVALDLTKKLLMLENRKGELPLDRFQCNDLPTRDYYIEEFLFTLRKEFGTRQRFELYVKEIVASVLPPDFTISLAKYEPAEINLATGQPKPKRGAQIQP